MKELSNTEELSNMVHCYIGMGSNLADPVDQIETALQELRDIPQTKLLKHSSFYQSKPHGPQDQPDFINAVAQLETSLSPHQLLKELHKIEDAHGRERVQHWGPRTLDLDILLFGEQEIDDDVLVVPHPHMWEREFVLRPLLELVKNSEALSP